MRGREGEGEKGILAKGQKGGGLEKLRDREADG